MASPPPHLAPERSDPGYAVLLRGPDAQAAPHHALHAAELASAFETLGVPLRSHDYQREVTHVSQALADPACRFFVCFDGHGSELLLTSPGSFQLTPAFERYAKPLFDVMDACPLHDAMRHQFASYSPARTLLAMDARHAQLSRLSGMATTLDVAPIALPAWAAAAPSPRPLGERPVELLLLADTPPPGAARARHGGAASFRDHVFRAIFERVAERAGADLRLDPWTQALVACQEAGMAFDLQHADIRFLLSSIADDVHAQRQRTVLEAARAFGVAVACPRAAEPALRAEFSAQAQPSPKSFDDLSDLLATLARARAVVLPTPNAAGHRSIALAALCAGTLVIAAADPGLEADFNEGEHLLVFRDSRSLLRALERVRAGGPALQRIASAGRARALDAFPPTRLVRRMQSLADAAA